MAELLRIPVLGPDGKRRDKYEALESTRSAPCHDRLVFLRTCVVFGRSMHVFRIAPGQGPVDPWGANRVSHGPDASPVLERAVRDRRRR